MKKDIQSPEFNEALKMYMTSYGIFPFDGLGCYCLSTCLHLKGDTFQAIYFTLRAQYADIPYKCQEELTLLLDEARKAYEQFFQERINRVKSSQRSAEPNYFLGFAKCFLKFLNVVYTKIGIGELSIVTKIMQENYHMMLENLLNNSENKEKTAQTLAMLSLSHILLVFCVSYSTENAVEPKETKEDLLKDDRVKECAKGTGQLLATLFSFLQKDFEKFADSLIPLAVYFTEKETSLQLVLDQVHRLPIALFDLIDKKLGEFSEEDKALLEKKRDCLTIGEDKFLGFKPFEDYFKKKSKEPLPEKESALRKTQIIWSFMSKVKENSKGKITEESKENGATIGFEDFDDFLDSQSFELVYSNSSIEKTSKGEMEQTIPPIKPKTMIVIDGRNVGIRYGDDCISSEGLKKCVDYWLSRNHPVQVIVPDYCLSQEEVDVRKNRAVLHYPSE